MIHLRHEQRGWRWRCRMKQAPALARELSWARERREEGLGQGAHGGQGGEKKHEERRKEIRGEVECTKEGELKREREVGAEETTAHRRESKVHARCRLSECGQHSTAAAVAVAAVPAAAATHWLPAWHWGAAAAARFGTRSTQVHSMRRRSPVHWSAGRE